MTPQFFFMVLIITVPAALGLITERSVKLIASILFCIGLGAYAVFLLPYRGFDVLPESDFVLFMSISLGALVGVVLANRINPAMFSFRAGSNLSEKGRSK